VFCRKSRHGGKVILHPYLFRASHQGIELMGARIAPRILLNQ
jgi:hypothetical protein